MIDTQAEFMKNVDKSLEETKIKMDSLVRLLEALDSVEEVLGSAMSQFRKQGVKCPSVLVKNCLEPKKLGVLWTYFKDQPLIKSFDFLEKKQEETEREIKALEKRQLRLQLCTESMKENTDYNFRTIKEPVCLPKIVEGRPCTPTIGKIEREDGKIEITEAYKSEDEEEDLKAGCSMTKPSHSNALCQRDEENKCSEQKNPEFMLVESMPMKAASTTENELNAACFNTDVSKTTEQDVVYIRPVIDLKELDGDTGSEAAHVVITGAMDKDAETSEPEDSDSLDYDLLKRLDDMELEDGDNLQREIFEEEDWLLPLEDEEDLQQVPSSFSEEIARLRKMASKLKQNANSVKTLDKDIIAKKPTQIQSSVQTQAKKPSVTLTKTSNETLKEEHNSPFTAKVLERGTNQTANIVGGEKKKKLSKFRRSLLKVEEN